MHAQTIALLDGLADRWAYEDQLKSIGMTLRRVIGDDYVGYDDLRDVDRALEAVDESLAYLEDDLANGEAVDPYAAIVAARNLLHDAMRLVPEGFTVDVDEARDAVLKAVADVRPDIPVDIHVL
jgi:hypothetical protein